MIEKTIEDATKNNEYSPVLAKMVEMKNRDYFGKLVEAKVMIMTYEGKI